MNRRILPLLGLLLAPSLYAAKPVMFDKTQTYCFGSYQVDRPVGAMQKGQGNNYYATGLNSGKGISDFTARVKAALTKRKQATIAYQSTTSNGNSVITFRFNSTDTELGGRGHYLICDFNSANNNKFEIPKIGIQARGNIETDKKPGQYKAEILLERNINNSSFILTKEELRSVLAKKEIIYCAVGRISYLSKPSFSLPIKIPREDILHAFKKAHTA